MTEIMLKLIRAATNGIDAVADGRYTSEDKLEALNEIKDHVDTAIEDLESEIDEEDGDK